MKPMNQVRTQDNYLLLRRWVQTFDQRCPLACVWFALGESLIAEELDEPPSCLPGLVAIFSGPGRLRHIHTLRRHSEVSLLNVQNISRAA